MGSGDQVVAIIAQKLVQWPIIFFLQFPNDICLSSYPANFHKYLMTFRWERNQNISLCWFFLSIFDIKSIIVQKLGPWSINFFIFS